MVTNRDLLISALRNFQVTNINDSVWFLEHVISDYHDSPLAKREQTKMWVGCDDSAFILQAFVVAVGDESVLNGYDGSIGYFVWDKDARMWDKVDFPTYAEH